MTQQPPPGSDQPYPGYHELPPPPAGYGPPGDGSGFERSGGLASAIVAIAVVIGALQWLSVLTAPSEVRAYRDFALSRTETYELTSYNLVGWLFGLVSIAAFVLTGIWLTRARRNADRIAPEQQRRAKAWAWWGWLVPIVAYWFPKQVVDDVWRSTVRDPIQPRTGWWWGSWIAMNLLSSFLTFTLFNTTGDIDALDNLVLIEVLVSVATTIALVGWIQVVQTVSQAQDALAAGPPPSAWQPRPSGDYGYSG